MSGRSIIVCLLWFLSACVARAHQNSIAFLYLEQTNHVLRARWDIPLHDLQSALNLDANEDGETTGEEVRDRASAVQQYAFQGLKLRWDGKVIEPVLDEIRLQNRVTGTAVVLLWEAPIPKAGPLSLTYDFQFEADPGHRCILVYRDRTVALSSGKRTFTFEAESAGHGFATFLREGVIHIFLGIDHICFLLALMLPAVWRGTASGWEAVGSFRTALNAITKIVTAFTLAHSITLALAALRIVVVPSAWVESIIALSVVVAALNNLWPIWTDRSWLVAFGFGLVHGFGFASALAELPASARALTVSLAGFNLGVEAGQLAIVLLFLPVAFILRKSWVYRWCAVRVGSAGIACLAAIWLIERAFNVTIF